MASHKDRVLACFEKHRFSPCAPYDSEHFLDFLLPGQAKKRAVYSSFTGLRRFNAFLDEIQLEFAVCFSLRDRDANYSLEKFVDRVQELERSRLSSLKSLNNQAKIGVEGIVIAINFGLLIALLSLRDNAWAMSVVGLMLVAFDMWYYRFHRKHTVYLKVLKAEIESRERSAV